MAFLCRIPMDGGCLEAGLRRRLLLLDGFTMPVFSAVPPIARPIASAVVSRNPCFATAGFRATLLLPALPFIINPPVCLCGLVKTRPLRARSACGRRPLTTWVICLSPHLRGRPHEHEALRRSRLFDPPPKNRIPIFADRASRALHPPLLLR
jgi:hypothetical protein